MRIKATLGDNITSTIANVGYNNAQDVSFLYVFTGDEINRNNYKQILPVRTNPLNIPKKEKYADLVSSHDNDGLILMNYDAGSRIYTNITNYPQYGIMTVPRSDYVNAISIYKKEIWYEMGIDADGNYAPLPVEETNYHLVTNESKNGTVYDFNVANNRYYKYLFRFVYSSKNASVADKDASLTEGLKEIIIPIKVGWNGWTLTELHEVESVDKAKYGDNKVYTASLTDVWKFKYNISPGDITQEVAKTPQDTLSRFPKFVHGPKNTTKGQVSCLLGRDVQPYDWQTITYSYGRDNSVSPTVKKSDWKWSAVYNNLSEPRMVNGFSPLNDTQGGPFTPHPRNQGGYNEELWPNAYYADRTSNKQIDLLNHWQKFCHSGNPKLLKDQTGNKYIVQIHDPSAHIEEGWEKRPITISFSWTQIGDANDCQILEEV